MRNVSKSRTVVRDFAGAITMARACEAGFIEPGHKVAMLGIGSGINCMMMAVDWNETRVKGETV